MKVTMVVPTYNDLESLTSLIKLIEEEKASSIDYLIVNNGSTNYKISQALHLKSDFWTSITLYENMGFGGGIVAGIEAAKTDWVGWMPGNLKIQPRDVKKLIDELQFRPNLFIKCRRVRSSRIAKLKTFTAGLIQSSLTGQNLFDTGGTPTICEKRFILKLMNLPNDYVIESRILYEARIHKLQILRPSIPYGKRIFGQSHWQRGIRSEARLMKAIISDSLGARKRNRSQSLNK